MLASPSRSGVFSEAADRRVERFAESISFDHRLFAHDIAGSIAHAQMLAAVGLISGQECTQICRALAEIREDIQAGRVPLRTDLEDIHMHVEQALIDRLGDVGRKLHTGRSRNDQVATDLRLWTRDALDRVDVRLRDLQRAFVSRCDNDFDIIDPNFLAALWDQLTGALILLTGVISSIGLLVGGIGVMNVMLISVTERTQEIGLRKATGATKFHIRAQFLFEAVMLSGAGGVIGILIGAFIAFVVRSLIPSVPATLSIFWILMGAGISVSVGLFFGYYPATRAANLDPIVALRYE